MFKACFELLNNGAARDPPDLLPSAIQILAIVLVHNWKKFVSY